MISDIEICFYLKILLISCASVVPAIMGINMIIDLKENKK